MSREVGGMGRLKPIFPYLLSQATYVPPLEDNHG